MRAGANTGVGDSELDGLVLAAAVGEQPLERVLVRLDERVAERWGLGLALAARGFTLPQVPPRDAAEAAARAHAAALVADPGAAPPETVAHAEVLPGLDGRSAGAMVLYRRAAPSAEGKTAELGPVERAALARRLTLVLEHVSSRALAARLAHRMNNALAGALANVEFVADLLGPDALDGPLVLDDPSTWDDVRSALAHARTSIRRLAELVRESADEPGGAVAVSARPPGS